MYYWYGLNQIEDDSWLLNWIDRGIVDSILACNQQYLFC